MAQDRHLSRALAALLPAGILGLSLSLASADATAKSSPVADQVDLAKPASVAIRLQAIRNSMSEALDQAAKTSDHSTADRETQLAWWGNGGWRNWGNGFRNGWNNWGNGWHNGWHNW
jgi:rSAM-associated Gly-rich repeat protein